MVANANIGFKYSSNLLKKTLLLSCLACLGFSNTLLAAPTVTLARASITAADMGIIIINGDPTSEAIGAYYQSARGIPASNVVRINLPAGYGIGSMSIPATLFSPLKAQVDAALPANVQATLLTWTKPYRVGTGTCDLSITSAFALGADPKYCSTPLSPAYFNSDSTTPWQDFGIRPSMMLGASTFASAKALIDRGIAADNTYPVGDGYLMRTTDPLRSIRSSDFLTIPALWDYPDGLKMNYIDNSLSQSSDFIQNKNSVLFYFTGLEDVPNINTNAYLPGAIADHLTSYGGDLSNPNQMKSTKWLEAGATASYGTVQEPGASLQKFPHATVVIDHYFRGATLIEAYWKSVRIPGVGLFLGEPLARPFADVPSSTIVGNEYVFNTRALRRNTPYKIQYRQNATGPWIDHFNFSTALPGLQSFHAPLAPSASELRLVKLPSSCPGPAASDTIEVYDNINFAPNGGDAVSEYKAVSIGPIFNDSQQAQGGRWQEIYFQIGVYNNATVDTTLPAGCDQNLNLSVPQLPDGISGTIVPSSFNLKPQEYAIALVTINVPGTVAQTNSATYSVPVKITDTPTGKNYLADPLIINLLAGTDNQAPLLRIKRPADNSALVDYPERTSLYAFPMESDVRPDSGIIDVSYELQALALDNGSDPSPYFISTFQNGLDTTLYPSNLPAGTYRLRARGYNVNSSLVATSEIQLYSDNIQVNQIVGNNLPNILTGTSGNDVIKGAFSSDRLTGGAGNNIYVYFTVNDGLDTIVDFVPGKDRIDLWQIYENLGYAKFSPAVKNFVRVVSVPTGAQIQVRLPSTNTYKPLATLTGVVVEAINLDRDLQLTPRQHIFAP